jgi:hypothetical protein
MKPTKKRGPGRPRGRPRKFNTFWNIPKKRLVAFRYKHDTKLPTIPPPPEPDPARRSEMERLKDERRKLELIRCSLRTRTVNARARLGREFVAPLTLAFNPKREIGQLEFLIHLLQRLDKLQDKIALCLRCELDFATITAPGWFECSEDHACEAKQGPETDPGPTGQDTPEGNANGQPPSIA